MTKTVEELIAELSKKDPKANVYLKPIRVRFMEFIM